MRFMDEKLKQQVLKEMRNPDIYLKDILKYIQDNIDDAFNYACRKNISLNEWQPDSNYNGQLQQKTVFLTVRMFTLWETALAEVLNEKLHKFGVKVKPAHDSIGDLEIIFPDGAIMKWEVKTTQGKDAFTGATHSASKCSNYILISYNINKDLKLSEKEGKNQGIITELAVFVWEDMKLAKWIGEPSENSSWTTLKLPSEILKLKPEIIVLGSLEPKQKWCRIIRKNLFEKESQNKL